jgi:hypothetical protein
MREIFTLSLMAGAIIFGSAPTVHAQNLTYCFQISQWPDTFRLTLVPVGDGIFQVAGQDSDPEANDVFAVSGTAIPVSGGVYKLGLTTFSHAYYNRQFSVEMTVSAATGAGTARSFDNIGISGEEGAYREDGTASIVSCAGFDKLLAGDRPNRSSSKRPR